jgi:hypothetical protein
MGGRWLIFWLGILCWIIVPVSWLAGDRRMAREAFAKFSTYNTSPDGLSLAHGYLREKRGVTKVNRLMRAIDLAHVKPGATVFRVGPYSDSLDAFFEQLEEEADRAEKEESEKPADGKETENTGQKKKPAAEKKPEDEEPETRNIFPLLTDEEEHWLRQGGRLVLGLDGPYGTLQTHDAPCTDLHQVFPGHAFPAVEPARCRALDGASLQHFHSVLLNGIEPVLARSRVGRGEVLAFALPEVFSNEQLSKAGHLALLDRLAGAGRPVYFDETIHGAWTESSILDLLVEWGLGWALILFLATAFLALWRRGPRLGVADRSDRDDRSDAIDLVDALGTLYDRSLDRESALRLYFQALTRAFHARTGLTGEALERAVREKTSGYDPSPRLNDISRDEFHRNLRILNGAYEWVIHGHTS